MVFSSKNKDVIIAIGLLASATIVLFLLSAQNSAYTLFFCGLTVGLVPNLFYAIRKSSCLEEKEAQKIQTQHTQLMEAVQTLNEGFILFDKNHKLVVANRALEVFFKEANVELKPGTDRKEIVKKVITWLTEGPQKEFYKQYMEDLDKNKNCLHKKLKWSLPNGRHLDVYDNFTHDQGIVSVYHDVTEQNAKQQELEEKSQLLTTIFKNIPIGISVYDNSLRLMNWNDKYVDLMNVSKDKIFTGMHLQQLLENNFDQIKNVGSTPEEYATMAIKALLGSAHARREVETKSGRIIDILTMKLAEGGYLCTFTDVTLTKSAQIMLQESEKRHRKMVELSPDATLVHKDSLIIFANASAIKLLNAKDLHSLIGKSVRKFFPTHDHEKLEKHFGGSDHMSVGDNISATGTQTIGFDGSRVDVEVEATAHLYGERPVMQLTVRDVSMQKKTQTLLKKAKDEAEYVSQLRGTFLANMSHELRTPLNAVIGFSEIIKDEIFGKVGSEKYIEYASDIHSSGKHLLDLINDILDLSKIEAGTQKLIEDDIELEPLIEECVRLVSHQREKAGVEVTANISKALPSVTGDSKMLKQVLINLLSNAIKFTPQGGKITINSDISSDGSLYLSVQDTGIGIKEDDIIKALTPFVQIDNEPTRKYNGTGLGLPLSKNLMELHGGSLNITSVYSEGTTVTITLPSDRVNRNAA